METLFFAAPVAGLIALIFAYYLVTKINKVDPGNEKMREIASAIHEGAMAFLNREYKVLVVFIIILAAIIAITGFVTEGEESMQPTTAVAFVIGAICSILAGNFGMRCPLGDYFRNVHNFQMADINNISRLFPGYS